MTASFEGHVDIVRILMDANAHVNTQDEVCCYFTMQGHSKHFEVVRLMCVSKPRL